MNPTRVTIYHNPACGTSRKVLGMIREAGIEPEVIEYLKTGWTRSRLVDLFKAMGARPGEVMRRKNNPAAELVAELGLAAAGVTDDQILNAMVAHPVLVERPIVVTPRGTRLCRPPETIKDLL